MTRITFWAISAIGVYLVLTRDVDNPSPNRLMLGWGLVIAGACALLVWDYHRYRQRKARREAEAAEIGNDEVESGG